MLLTRKCTSEGVSFLAFERSEAHPTDIPTLRSHMETSGLPVCVGENWNVSV